MQQLTILAASTKWFKPSNNLPIDKSRTLSSILVKRRNMNTLSPKAGAAIAILILVVIFGGCFMLGKRAEALREAERLRDAAKIDLAPWGPS
jgi:hypothetical protein